MPLVDLPIGTVTFLFTDIVGSTRLWESHPSAMRVALPQHEAAIRVAVERNSGAIFKSVGDGFCAVFNTANEALDAAIEAQIKLRESEWPDGIELLTRMSIHTGAAVCRENDYFGPPLNRVARLLATAHGGQILLSDVSHDLVRDSLPKDTHMQALGEHRLRDLYRPESVFQVCHTELETRFPRLRSLDNPELPNNLPPQLTNFIGREEELALLGSFINRSRLVTLTGTGGCGKTRLSLQAAADALEDFPQGVWLVELASIRDPALVNSAVASTLGVREAQGQPILRTVAEDLKPKKMLLVLDNCEHLVDACAETAAFLLRACPGLKILCSSREALGVDGELTFRVPSMRHPEVGGVETPEALSQYEAVRLFIERATLHDPEFAVTNQNAPAVASICRHLDGIALALELAAARVTMLSVEEINQRLAECFRLLSGGNRSAMPRQQTLRATIDWSFDLLSYSEQTLLERLSVFEGGWTMTQAESVCDGPPIDSAKILHAHSLLVAKSMVQVLEGPGLRRYRLLETVRHYAQELSVQNGSAGDLRERHLRHFAESCAELETSLVGRAQVESLSALDRDLDNIRAALTYGFETGSTHAAQLAASLWRYWEIRGLLNEGSKASERALSIPIEDGGVKAKLLNGAGNLAFSCGRLAEAERFHLDSLELRRHQGEPKEIAISLNNLSLVYASAREFNRAKPLLEESLAMRRKAGDGRGIGVALFNLAMLTRELGDLDGAQHLLAESHEAFNAIWDTRGTTTVQSSLALLDIDRGKFSAASTRLIQVRQEFHRLGDKIGETTALVRLAQAARGSGETAAAAGYLVEAHDLGQVPENLSSTVAWLNVVAAVLVDANLFTEGAQVLGMLMGQSKGQPMTLASSEDEILAAKLACEGALGAVTLERLMEQGGEWTHARASAFALSQVRTIAGQ